MSTKHRLDQTAGLPDPKTQRGRDTREQILSAARRLVSERWVDEVPFTDLAEAAQVARASLLYAFGHWRNVLWDLFEEEMDLLDEARTRANRLRRRRLSDGAFEMLAVLLDRADETGLLYPNLRGAMSTWQGEPTDEALFGACPSAPLRRDVLAAWALVRLQPSYEAVEELLGIPQDKSLGEGEVRPVPIGECLVNFALDLAAGSPSSFSTLQDRRLALRRCLDVFADSLGRGAPRRARPRQR